MWSTIYANPSVQGGPHLEAHVARDKVGAQHRLQLIGMSTSSSRVAGKIGQALRFPNTYDIVSVDSTNFKFAASPDFSAAACLKTSDIGYYHQPFGIESADNRVGWAFIINGIDIGYVGKISFSVDYGVCCQGPQSASAVNDNRWHYVVGVRNGSIAKLYIDGKLEDSTQLSGTPDMSAAYNLTIGSDWNGYFPYNGSIDDVRIYNRALSATEVQQLYNMGR